MSTPKGFKYLAPSPEAITKALNKERDVETPELDYFRGIIHDDKYTCEQEHRSLHPAQTDRIRNTIADFEYHKTELEFLQGLYFQTIHEKLLSKHMADGEHTLDGIKRMITSYRRRLAKYGVRGDDLRKRRLNITNKNYWKSEADLLEQQASYRESKVLAKLAREHVKEALRSRRTQVQGIRKSARVAAQKSSASQAPPK